jgi:hypothetical protein
MPHPYVQEGADDERGKEKGTGIPEGKAEIESSVELNPLL